MFNAAKCNIMRVSRKQTPIPFQYELSGQVLEEVKDAKYLGVTVSDGLEWTKHIDAIASSEAQPEGLSRKAKGNGILLPSKVLLRIQRHCLPPPPKIQLRQTGDGAAKGCSLRERQVWNI